MVPHQEPQDTLGGSNSSSMVKDKVQALIDQLVVLLGLKDMHKPYFIYLLEGDLDGIISCMLYRHLA